MATKPEILFKPSHLRLGLNVLFAILILGLCFYALNFFIFFFLCFVFMGSMYWHHRCSHLEIKSLQHLQHNEWTLVSEQASLYSNKIPRTRHAVEGKRIELIHGLDYGLCLVFSLKETKQPLIIWRDQIQPAAWKYLKQVQKQLGSI